VNSEEISKLLRPYVQLVPEQLAHTFTYINILMKWNARVNLTAIRNPQEIVQRHFGESYYAARHLLGSESIDTVVDVGSGAGFPGIPLAIFCPGSRVTLIESNGKKAAFLNEVVRTLGLPNVTVFSQRAEVFAEKAKLVTMRAVEHFELSLPLAAGLVEDQGRLGLLIGAGQAEAVAQLAGPLSWAAPVQMPGGHSRVLLIGVKT
jgi:16S rRNA (guanine527-N7)-methyltransferase